ncbi:MAG: hypothetical protein H0A76_10115 [Candidatus Thiodubiliella endoseptemdiera]|uniref:Calcium-binding protein n=1 Tax=Candidatus Thiodubiliella endoseptemdiera TaxID=2738886 RepID=A0A853F5B2_9GAMM|nr:hypothetical protein [Candidatus Thiodubiliella endoseptemdiera]
MQVLDTPQVKLGHLHILYIGTDNADTNGSAGDDTINGGAGNDTIKWRCRQ